MYKYIGEVKYVSQHYHKEYDWLNLTLLHISSELSCRHPVSSYGYLDTAFSCLLAKLSRPYKRYPHLIQCKSSNLQSVCKSASVLGCISCLACRCTHGDG